MDEIRSFGKRKSCGISVLMVCVMVLALCAGCAKKEAAWSLEELSDKQKEKVEEVWKGQFYDPAFTIKESNYYGSCGDCVIILCISPLGMMEEFVVAGEEFAYNRGFSIWVYKKGEIIQLADAYAEGWLTDENIADIAEYHRERNKEWLEIYE